MKIDNEDFMLFSKELEESTNDIFLKRSATTYRKGGRRLRDRIIFTKMAWLEALSFVGIIQTLVVFFALIPISVQSVNHFFVIVGIGFQFPLYFSSVAIMVCIFFIMVFGFVALRFIGTAKVANEVSAKMNPGVYILWKQNKELQERIRLLEEKK